jgi:hypothetical protein
MRWLVKSLLVAALVAGASDASSGQAQPRPWRGTWSGAGTVVGSCGNGTLLVEDNGTGYAEHMGNSTHLSTYCLDPVTLNGSGIGVETAANGDELHFDLTIQIILTSASDGIWQEAETVTGGTGRFVAATGSSTSSGTFTLTSPTTTVWEGTHTAPPPY